MRTSKLPGEDKRHTDNLDALSFYRNAKLRFYVYRLTLLHLWENFSLVELVHYLFIFVKYAQVQQVMKITISFLKSRNAEWYITTRQGYREKRERRCVSDRERTPLNSSFIVLRRL